MHSYIKARLHRTRNSAISIAAIVAASLVLAAPALQAKEKDSNDEGWGEWKAMDKAFVARRRQPPGLDLPKSERRQANVQARLEKLLKKKRKLLAKLEGNSIDESSSGDALNPKKVRKQLAKLEKQIAKLTRKENRLAAKAKKQGNKTTAVWLHTGEEGLYSITLADLAAKLGKAEKKLRKNAKQGKLNLTTAESLDSETAKQAVSWHYDETSDSILFAAQAYDTFYSDENAFRLKAGGKKAAPMAVTDGMRPSSFVSGIPFQDELKFEVEEDLLYLTWAVPYEPDADFWFWGTIRGGVEDPDHLHTKSSNHFHAKLFVPNPASTGSFRLRITLRGTTDKYTGDEHHVIANINGTDVGSVTWDGFEEKVLDVQLNQQGIFNADGNNILTLKNVDIAGSYAIQRLDQVELDYQRSPVAYNDRLWMHNVAGGTQTANGFTSADILVIESPDGDAVLRKDILIEPDTSGDGWQVTFNATENADFLIAALGAAIDARATTDNRAGLRKRNNGAEYLIIAPRGLSDTAEALALYRGYRYSQVKVAWLDDIYNEFSAGREDPVALARFMKRVVSKWGIVPMSVVLIGKGSVDQKDRMGFSDSFLPVVMTSTPWTLAASDARLLGFEEDTPFTIGRIPVTNNIEGVEYVEKLRRYETTTPGSEKFSAVLVADNPDTAGYFHANSDRLSDRLKTLGFDAITKLYHPATPVSVRTNLIKSETWNTGYVSYDGHGSRSQIGSWGENFMSSYADADNKYGDAGRLTNSSYPIFTALTCSVGNDTHPGARSLASALVLNPAGGAIASVAPTGLSLDRDAQILGNAFVDNLFAANSTIGEALRGAKTETRGTIDDFMLRIYTVIGEPGVYAR